MGFELRSLKAPAIGAGRILGFFIEDWIVNAFAVATCMFINVFLTKVL